MVDILNHLGVDYFTQGNHEFDFGSDAVANLMDMSEFKWLGSNVRHSDSRQLFHHTVDVDTFEVSIGTSDSSSSSASASASGTISGRSSSSTSSCTSSSSSSIRVGVFGVCTQRTPSLADPGDKVVFEDPVEHARRCITELKQVRGCDFVMGLTHVELSCDRQIAELAGVDVIIGGHDHEPFYLVHHGTTIIKCGQNIDHLGVLDIRFNRCDVEAHKVRAVTSFQLLSTEGVQSDPAVDLLIQKWIDLLPKPSGDDEVLCCVGDTPVSTLTRDLRSRETAFACHVADAIVWSYRDHHPPCDLGIQNGGFVRQDMVYKPGVLLMKSAVLDEMPFPRKCVLLELSLRHIRLGLEQMLLGCPAHVGSFPHMSAHWNVVVDLKRDKLQRVVSISYRDELLDITTGWVAEGAGTGDDCIATAAVSDSCATACALDARLFLVSISDFYVGKDGDGVEAFALGRVVADHQQLISHCVVDYLRECVDVIDGDAPGRLVLVNNA